MENDPEKRIGELMEALAKAIGLGRKAYIQGWSDGRSAVEGDYGPYDFEWSGEDFVDRCDEVSALERLAP